MQPTLQTDLTLCKSKEPVTWEPWRASITCIAIRSYMVLNTSFQCNFSYFSLDSVPVAVNLNTHRQTKMRWLVTVPIYLPPLLMVMPPPLQQVNYMFTWIKLLLRCISMLCFKLKMFRSMNHIHVWLHTSVVRKLSFLVSVQILAFLSIRRNNALEISPSSYCYW